jgi:hypothetical protein
MPAMKQRRRMWWLAGAMLIPLAAVVWLFSPVGGGQPSVRLVLLGYTNQPVPLHWENSAAQPRFLRPVATVMATNTGDCKVELWPSIAPRFLLTNASGVTMAYNMCSVEKLDRSRPQYLGPGESVVFEVWPEYGREVWQFEMAYHPRSAQKDLFRRAAIVSGPEVSRWLQKIYRSPETFYAELGPFTNLQSRNPQQ